MFIITCIRSKMYTALRVMSLTFNQDRGLNQDLVHVYGTRARFNRVLTVLSQANHKLK